MSLLKKHKLIYYSIILINLQKYRKFLFYTGGQSVSGASPQLPEQSTEDSQANDSSDDEDNGQGGAGDHNITGSGNTVNTIKQLCCFVNSKYSRYQISMHSLSSTQALHF